MPGPIGGRNPRPYVSKANVDRAIRHNPIYLYVYISIYIYIYTYIYILYK
jgi:hypothetical protein